MRAAASKDGDRSDRRPVQRLERVIDDVRPLEFTPRLCEYARAIECDIAVADDDRVAAAEIRIEVRELRVPVVPADELRGSDDSGKLFAGNAEFTVVGRSGRKDDRIIKLE